MNELTNEITTVRKEIAGKELVLESGRLAKQAGGSVVCRMGDTMVLASATMSSGPRVGLDFLPLTVDYRENRYAAGKFPGGFFKREGRPSERETLTSRCIDRPVRPLFPEGFKHEIQVLISVLSFDQENDTDILAMIASFAALEISDIPFHGGIGAVRIGTDGDELVVNPSVQQVEEGTINLTIAGSRNAINMVEGGADEESEERLLQAFELAQQSLKDVIDAIEELKEKCGKPKLDFQAEQQDEQLVGRIRELTYERLKEASANPDKHARQEAIDTLCNEIVEQMLTEKESARQATIDKGELSESDTESLLEFKNELAEVEHQTKEIIHDLEKEIVRERILNEGLRSDDRKPHEIRPITCDIGLIPRTHGSALFTRGQTQALVLTTLGTISDEQKIDGLGEDIYKKFILHYNFPPFSVGEVKPIRGPGRREVGHGALAERALTRMIPEHDEFPYTIRVVSDILESNGSSSMASVCGGSLALMDAGVPIKSAVAGIAMGLIKEGDQYAILSDILGVEDHLGDMDFKVAGTRKGITAFQMDLKIEGVTSSIMAEALEQARQGRLYILDIMDNAISESRQELSPFAPRINMMTIPIDKIRDVIGPGGKMIRKIILDTGAKIDIDDEGRVVIASVDEEAGRKAKEWIEYLTEDVEIGKIYHGKVTRLVNFGAFVEVLPGQEGLVHISEIAERRINRVEDELNEGDEIDVKVIEVDDLGRINLSKRQADIDLGRIPAGGGGGGGESRSSGRGNRGGRSGGGGRDRGDRDRGGRGGKGRR